MMTTADNQTKSSNPLMTAHPFESLTPDFILDAVESQGYLCDGRILALNSYENRVYQIGIDQSSPLIAKFYRPERWSDPQIKEEHGFTFELEQQELPVVTPIRSSDQASLFFYNGFRFSLFPQKGGHAPELDLDDNLEIMGRFLARIHNIGSTAKFQFRPTITLEHYGHDSVEFILEHFMPRELDTAYRTLTDDLLTALDQRIAECGTIDTIRVHGDCHCGNILWRDGLPHFVDFDDTRMAPAIQDIWMLLSGDIHQQRLQMDKILKGYELFRNFDFREIKLIEVYRTLRILYYSAWLARRWQDPAFPHSFPWFNTTRYWEEHILELREQYAALMYDY